MMRGAPSDPSFQPDRVRFRRRLERAAVCRPAALFVVLLGSVSLAGCNGVLAPAGPIGAAQRIVLFDATVIMLAIVVPVIVAIAGFAWWFRQSNQRAFYWPDWEFSGTLELIVWSIPTLVIVFLGGIAWFGSRALDPFLPIQGFEANPVEVQVVALDWKWLFLYPDVGIASVNELAVPIGQPIHFRLTSAGVMNSFFAPQLGSQIYTMAGMTSQLYLQADEPGTYRGFSANFSGDGFAGMHFDVRAMSADDYAKWLADAASSKTALDRNAYAELVKPSENVPPTVYRSVEPGLFESIVNGTAPQPPSLSASALSDPDRFAATCRGN
jgi:cytochrome o ubiquinol oxidase subunit II